VILYGFVRIRVVCLQTASDNKTKVLKAEVVLSPTGEVLVTQ